MAEHPPLIPVAAGKSPPLPVAASLPSELHPQQLRHEALAQLARLACDPTRGLSREEVARRQRVHGPNQYNPEQGTWLAKGVDWPWLIPLGFCGVAAAAWDIAGAPGRAWVALAAGIFLTAIGFVLAQGVAHQKRRQAAPPWQVTVLRAGRIERVAVAQLVPGDIVWLSRGARFPAELMVLAASADWQVGGAPPDERVESGSAWAVVVRLRPRDDVPGAQHWRCGWGEFAAIAGGAMLGSLALFSDHSLLWAIGQGAFAAALLWPQVGQLANRRRHLAALAALAGDGLWCRGLLLLPALARRDAPWCCTWPAWLPRWQVAAMVLPFDTLTVEPLPDGGEEKTGEVPLCRLWRSGRQVVNPLAVTGAVALAQATRLLLAPGPNRVGLLPLPPTPLVQPLWQLTEMLVGETRTDPCSTWQVVRRERRPELGGMGWEVHACDPRGRIWVVASGEPEALWAAGVRQCITERPLDSGQWQARLAPLRAAGGWAVAVAMHRWPNALLPEDPLPELRWAGVWLLTPERAAIARETANWPIAIADHHPFPASVVALWQARGWWPAHPACALPAQLPASDAPWVAVAPDQAVLLMSDAHDETPWADGAMPQGDLAALVAAAKAARAWHKRLIRATRGERFWRWAVVMLASVIGLVVEAAVVPLTALLFLVVGWCWPISRGTILEKK